MSWLAEYFKELGFIVSGSDRVKSKNLEKLRKKGIRVFEGHDKRNVDDAHVVVFSDAISEDNVELKEARQRGLYILSRGEALSSVAENFGDTVGVAGCHGKTTTTCMIAHIFKCASLKFTAHVGGEDVSLGNFVMQGSDVFLSEVCEFKKNINKRGYKTLFLFFVAHEECVSTGGFVLDAVKGFAKALEVNNFTFTQEFNYIVNIRIVGNAKNVVVGCTCFLFCCQVLNKVGNGVAGYRESCCREGVAA